MNIVIVGGSFAGIHAAIYLRQLMPTSEIYLIEKQSKLGWIPCKRPADNYNVHLHSSFL